MQSKLQAKLFSLHLTKILLKIPCSRSKNKKMTVKLDHIVGLSIKKVVSKTMDSFVIIKHNSCALKIHLIHQSI
jgi:hypothetical protein